MTRGSIVFPLNSDFNVVHSDSVRIGEGGMVKLISDGGAIHFGEGTYATFFDPDDSTRTISPPEIPWDQDPNYKYSSSTEEYLETLLQDLVEFHEENRPDYLETCMTAATGLTAEQCLSDIIIYIYNGIMWFDKKIAADYHGSSMVLTPTAAITTDGTQFIVEVAPDGATTVTTLEGTVFVMDLASRKTVILGVNSKVTVPKTAAGLGEQELQQSLIEIDPESIDQFWIKDADLPKNEKLIFYAIPLMIIVVGIIGLLFAKKLRKK